MQNLLNIFPSKSSEEIGSYICPKSSSQFLKFSATSSKLELTKAGETKDTLLYAFFIKSRCLIFTDKSSSWLSFIKFLVRASLSKLRFFLVFAEIANPSSGAFLLLRSILFNTKIFFLLFIIVIY